MVNRELGLAEVEKRCRPLYNSLSLKNVMRVPSRAIDEDDMPCILIMEGDDDIVNRSSRDFIGYPCKRKLDVIVECWDLASGNVRNICLEARKAVLASKGVLLNGVVINESKTVGPFNLGVPNMLGMRIIFNLFYKDDGPVF